MNYFYDYLNIDLQDKIQELANSLHAKEMTKQIYAPWKLYSQIKGQVLHEQRILHTLTKRYNYSSDYYNIQRGSYTGKSYLISYHLKRKSQTFVFTEFVKSFESRYISDYTEFVNFNIN